MFHESFHRFLFIGMSEGFTEEENKLISWLDQNGWVKPGQFIHCEKADATEITVSKFGGKIPHLPNEEIPKCPTCGHNLEVLVQLYVPNLPQNIQHLLPEKLSDALIVLFVCPEDLADMQGKMVSRVYHADQISSLVYENPNEGAQIESALFKNFEEMPTYNDTGDDYMEKMEEIDDAEMEELMRKIRDEIRTVKCYFGGFPYYQQGEATPGNDCTLLLNVEQDDGFSMMWGDAGNAQIWVKKDDSCEFYLNWQCG